jgi:hypothetical protein
MDPREQSLGGSWMPNISAFPNDARASSLSQVLLVGPIPSRFFLSARASAGILLRAVRRKKTLPAPMMSALESVAAQG